MRRTHLATDPDRRRRTRKRFAGMVLAAATALSIATCGDDGIAVGSNINLEFEGMRALDPATEGTLHAWVVDRSGERISLGPFDIPEAGHVIFPNPIDDPQGILITIEPPGDTDPAPSSLELLGGSFEGPTADLRIDGHVTTGLPLRKDIGSHVLFTPANNSWLGYPSIEDAGIWVFNIHAIGDPMRREGLDLSNEFFLEVTPLASAWTYEGWVVHEYGTPDECWISYGKMVPGVADRLNRQDNTGFGPFSGYLDYVGSPSAIENNFPGDDWVENPYGLPVPCGLEIPFDMNGTPELGIKSPWTHVITIEPASDALTESPEVDPAAPLTAKPFLIQPYKNAFGEGPPDQARVILYNDARVPKGTARLWG
jgi:hypothetical protein